MALLEKNHKVKDINQFKKQLNWGELPAFYHMVASSVGEVESILLHGFDNALIRLVDRRQWNLRLLNGVVNKDGEIICEQKPKLWISQSVSERGFELHAYPMVQGHRIDHYIHEHRLLEYNTWDPVTMGRILRISQLNKFIELYFKNGDEADLALIKYAARLVDGVLLYLKKHVDVICVDGVSIKTLFEQVKTATKQEPINNLLFINKSKS